MRETVELIYDENDTAVASKKSDWKVRKALTPFFIYCISLISIATTFVLLLPVKPLFSIPEVKFLEFSNIEQCSVLVHFDNVRKNKDELVHLVKK